MKILSKIIVYFMAVCLLSWLLPWLYTFLTVSPQDYKFTLYSSVVKDFTFTETHKNGPTIYKDLKGNEYTMEQFDSINPFFFYRQLLAKDVLPDTINGVPITVQLIRKTNFTLKQSPRDVNVNAPKLYLLMESIPSRVDLEAPKEAFRLTDNGIEILDMASNQVEDQKSALFNKVMKDKGFKFPVMTLNGNATNLKEYDEGYIMIDADYQPYQVKQMKGRPYVKKIDVDKNLKLNSALITEFSDKKSLALVEDVNNDCYIINHDNTIHKLPFKYDPKKESIMIIGNMLDWTVRISDYYGNTTYAINANDYSLIGTNKKGYEPETTYEKVAKVIFPFTIYFTSGDNKWVKACIDDFSSTALILNLILAVIFMVIKRKDIKNNWIKGVCVLVFGIYSFIAFSIIKN